MRQRRRFVRSAPLCGLWTIQWAKPIVETNEKIIIIQKRVFCWCWDVVAKRREKIKRGEVLRDK